MEARMVSTKGTFYGTPPLPTKTKQGEIKNTPDSPQWLLQQP